ncbi:adenosine receptor A1-like isoform X2 [Dunckerocampus dactyliophorus]|uniref:adenosine receptor A1-like isoform X2 n=1 Tax=Dunckerocampus dactyliophorus TaxID=161453 RepID=UPI002405C88E|nr:adenosine receptor A1-like isoform X2 [Dunckerocampus dactyliophorus]
MSSSPAVKVREHADTLYISIEAAIALASVLGNVLVVLVVCVNRTLRNTTFCFIVSLAVADIAVGVLVIPLAVTISLGINTQFYTCLFLSCLLVIITQSSILSLLAIAVDRYLRVKIPTRYSTIVTQKRAYVAVCLCWVISFLTGLVPMVGWNNRHVLGNLSRSDYMVCKFTTVMTMDYMVYFNFFGWVVAPLVVMIALYGEIFRVIRRQLNRRAEATSDGSSIPKLAVYVGIFMSHVNSALNPLVYAFRIKRFRVTLLEITRRCMSCKAMEPSPYTCSMPALTEKGLQCDPVDGAK